MDIMEVDEPENVPGPSKVLDDQPTKKSCNLPW